MEYSRSKLGVTHLERSEEQISAMFDRIAPRYDFLNALLSMRQDRSWRRKLLEQIPTIKGGHFVDVATGTGDVIVAAEKAHPEYCRFLGVDISKAMLEIAYRKSFRANGKIQFELMSAEKLTLQDSSTDCVTIAFGLRNVVDRINGLKEFFRILKPGGRLIVLEFFPPQKTLFARLFRFYFHKILPAIGGLISDRSAYQYLPKSVDGFFTHEEFDETCRNIGFEIACNDSFLFGSCRLVCLDRPRVQ